MTKWSETYIKVFRKIAKKGKEAHSSNNQKEAVLRF